MLGLGAGAIAAATAPMLRRAQTDSVVMWGALIAGALVPLSYLAICWIQLNTIDLVDGVLPIFRLVVVCLSLFAPFLAIGVTLAVIFGSNPGEMNRLYSADLLGAGLGCALCVPLFTAASPPAAVMLAGALFAVSAIITSSLRFASRAWCSRSLWEPPS
jgi:hypothetical protein